MYCIGLDIGSSSIKGGILNCENGEISDVRRAPFPEPAVGGPGYFEVCPETVLAATTDVLGQLLECNPDVGEVRICSQMGGILLADGSGQAVSPYFSWRDQRSLAPVSGGSDDSFLASLERRLSPEQFVELGRELKPGSALTLLAWLQQHGQLPQAQPLTIGDFVISRLCRAPARMHRTHALGLLNLKTGDWHQQVLESCGLGDLNWPALAETQAVVGEWKSDHGALPIFPAIGDQQAALKGIDLMPQELSLNISTGSQVSRITADFEPGQCQTRCWFGGQFLNTVTHIPAGRSLTVLFQLLTELAGDVNEANAWQQIDAAVGRSKASGLRCDLSFFAAATGDQGEISGISVENLNVGNLFLAAFTFMADSYRRFSRQLDPAEGWSGLAVSGGLVQRFAVLRSLLQERFGCDLREIAEQEETLGGLLRLAQERAAGC